MTAYSILDLAPIPEGFTAADALANSVDLAQNAEAQGYTRYWFAEHHNTTGIASAATSIVIGHVAGKTKTIRVGAGGIMLPNHAPLMVAEQFGTLATLYPDRIDLGLGRAPGTDMATARALRRMMQQADTFPEDVVELIGYLAPPQPGQRILAVPGEGTEVPIYMLGSSLFGAQLAAHLGLPYAFASHFAPDALDDAAYIYRRDFKPGQIEKPHFILAANLFAADTDDEAARLRTSMQQSFLKIRRGEMRGKLPKPVDDFGLVATPDEQAMVNQMLRITAVGGPARVQSQLAALIERYRPDEIILTGMIHDHAARCRSFEIGAQAMQALNTERIAS
ncbi:LLM class flavin-dependent oxidoreductase [Maritimibacter sp. DP1N21-5]|uniref:LLM class flavin-dependent oxidoreductase n=1 Tax=Maritimibacter sp. DP1N21-5 TaxID=2836867 RepID=UPI001C48058D|nr:LLM class flavin-dependent oxidoreductase [Maritimibacter sp. DP1N21-5]MBV7408427.1 LLM class flavin-dependent oxidoreductase [Maritimibacter sp. DP1N21-5]